MYSTCTVVHVHEILTKVLSTHLVHVESSVGQTISAEAAFAPQLRSPGMNATHQEAQRVLSLRPGVSFDHRFRALCLVACTSTRKSNHLCMYKVEGQLTQCMIGIYFKNHSQTLYMTTETPNSFPYVTSQRENQLPFLVGPCSTDDICVSDNVTSFQLVPRLTRPSNVLYGQDIIAYAGSSACFV
jgi:hypothetical protein